MTPKLSKYFYKYLCGPYATLWHVARFTSGRLFHCSKKKYRTWTVPSLPALGCGVHAAYTDGRWARHEREELFGKRACGNGATICGNELGIATGMQKNGPLYSGPRFPYAGQCSKFAPDFFQPILPAIMFGPGFAAVGLFSKNGLLAKWMECISSCEAAILAFVVASSSMARRCPPLAVARVAILPQCEKSPYTNKGTVRSAKASQYLFAKGS